MAAAVVALCLGIGFTLADQQSAESASPAGNPKTVSVAGTADIYASGLSQVPDLDGGGGTLPLSVGAASGRIFTFSATGTVGCRSGGPASPPDGTQCAGDDTAISAYDTLSGITDSQAQDFLVGVFSVKKPSNRSQPDGLDFSPGALGHDFASLSPKLNQVFFIGDGHTSAGQAQTFVAPKHATRLYLGIADAFVFEGNPGYYSDDYGTFTVSVTSTPPLG